MEIERKFLVTGEAPLDGVSGEDCIQGYIATSGASVRVRIMGAGAWLTIKGRMRDLSRSEFEYAIPVEDARAMLDEFCGDARIHKTRYRLEHAGHTWEVDVFHGANEGLVMAEVELDAPDEPVEIPAWCGREVSDDFRYFNASLVQHPYSSFSS